MIPEAVTHAKWSVMWKGKSGYIVEKKFDNDFQGALNAYTTLHEVGKKWLTLRCCNAGFAPPAHITQHEETYYRVVTRRGKKFKKKATRLVNQMEELNAMGEWWCPYCAQLRTFYRDPDEQARVVMRCPVCTASNYDFHVRRWNPQAQVIEYHTPRR